MDIFHIVKNIEFQEYELYLQMKNIPSIEATRYKFFEYRFDVFLACKIVQNRKLYDHYSIAIKWTDICDDIEWECFVTLCVDYKIIKFLFSNKNLKLSIKKSIQNILCYTKNFQLITQLLQAYKKKIDIMVVFSSLCNSDEKVHEFVQKRANCDLNNLSIFNFEYGMNFYLRNCNSERSLILLHEIYNLKNTTYLKNCLNVGNLFGVKYFYNKIENLTDDFIANLIFG